MIFKKKTLGAGVALLSLVGSLGLSSQAMAVENVDDSHSEKVYTQEASDALWAEVQAFIDANPTDLAGIEELTHRLYDAPDMVVSVSGASGTMSGEEAQVLLDDRAVVPEGADLKTISPMAVPTDAFTVSFAWIPQPITEVFGYAAYGTWNFRDDYVNGSDPDDIAAIRLELNHTCTNIVDTVGQSYYYDNTKAVGNSYLQDAGVGTDSPVYAFDDATSGFMLNVDHGYVMTRTASSCGPTTSRGMFTYEHNQDGGAVVAVGASFGGFGVSYNGSPATLQRSSGIADLKV